MPTEKSSLEEKGKHSTKENAMEVRRERTRTKMVTDTIALESGSEIHKP